MNRGAVMLWFLTVCSAWAGQVPIPGTIFEEVAGATTVVEGVIADWHEDQSPHPVCVNLALGVATVRILRVLKGEPTLTSVDVVMPIRRKPVTPSSGPVERRRGAACPVPPGPALETEDHVLLLLVSKRESPGRYTLKAPDMVFWNKDAQTFGSTSELPVLLLPSRPGAVPDDLHDPTYWNLKLGSPPQAGVPWTDFLVAIEDLTGAL